MSAITKFAKMLMGEMADNESMLAMGEILIRKAIDERLHEILNAAETSPGLEEAIDAEIDRRIAELGNDFRLRAKDNHCGHTHQVVLLSDARGLGRT